MTVNMKDVIRAEASKVAVEVAGVKLVGSRKEGGGYEEIGYAADGRRLAFVPSGYPLDQYTADLRYAAKTEATAAYVTDWLAGESEVVRVQYCCGNRYVVPSEEAERIAALRESIRAQVFAKK
jgi:hypothetical protein